MEILTGKMDDFFKRNNIKAEKEWEGVPYNSVYQVWKLDKNNYNKLDNTDDNKYNDCEWWQYAESSNKSIPTKEYIINNKSIIAWDSPNREDLDYYNDREYANLLEYFCYEVGASLEENIIALSVDLAKYNNMTVGELFNTYQRDK